MGLNERLNKNPINDKPREEEPPRPSSLQASIDASREEERRRALAATGVDTAAGIGTGLARGYVGLPGIPGDLIGLGTEAYFQAIEQAHGKETADRLRAQNRPGAQPQGPGPVAGENLGSPTVTSTEQLWPTSGQLQRGVAKNIPGMEVLNFQPKTTLGKVGQVAGEFAGGAVLPAAVATRGLQGGERVTAFIGELVKQGVAPGIASESAGQILEWAAPDTPLGTIARMVAPMLVGGGREAVNPRAPLRAEVEVPHVGPTRAAAAARSGEGVVETGGPARAANEMQRVGPEATLADVSPRLRGQTEALYTTPGPQQQVVRDFVTRRQELHRGDNSRLNQVLDQHIEPRAANFADQTEQMQNARRAQANTLYGQAAQAAAGQTISPQPALDYLDRVLPTSVAQGAVEGLTTGERRIQQLQRQVAGRTDYESLHALQADLRREIAALRRENPNAINIEALSRTREHILDSLDNATRRQNGTSIYGDARRAYRTDSDIMEAVEYGRTMFDKDIRPDEFARYWRNASPEERTAIRMGARDGIDATVGPASNDSAAGLNKLKSNWNRGKLNVMLGQDGAGNLIGELDGIARSRGTVQHLEGQSATAGRQAGQKEIPNPADPAVAKPPLNQAPTMSQVIVGLGQRLYANTIGRLNADTMRAENVDNARLNVAQVPPEYRREFLDRLAQVYEQSQRRRLPPGVEAGYAGYQGYRSDQ